MYVCVCVQYLHDGKKKRKGKNGIKKETRRVHTKRKKIEKRELFNDVTHLFD
jgi:hypothetical protein